MSEGVENKKPVRRKSNTSKEGQQIVMRFFIAVRELINRKTIRGVQTFTDRYSIDRRNFLFLEANPEKKQFDVGWLHFIVKDYGVNMEWLILGKGPMFKNDFEKI